MTERSQLLARDLLEGRLDQQVDNLAFTAQEGAGEASHVLAHSLVIDATPIRSNHAGVVINGEAIDLFPRVTFRLTSDGGNLVPLIATCCGMREATVTGT